jgi:hypothetical protein
LSKPNEKELSGAVARKGMTMEWQPIETAPKEALILLYAPSEVWPTTFVGCYSEEDGKPAWTDADGTWLEFACTHWMPLPPPPNEPQ